MANARDVYVDITIRSVDPLDFDVLPSPKNNPQLPTNPGPTPGRPIIIFQNDEHPGFNIHFELQGDTLGYFFPPNQEKDDAVWSKCGSDCPEHAVWDVFKPLNIVDAKFPAPPNERRVLVVHNANPPSPAAPHGQGPFQYNLRVTNGTCWQPLDPGGTNENGSYRSSQSSVVTYAAVIVGVAAAAIAVTEALHITNIFR